MMQRHSTLGRQQQHSPTDIADWLCRIRHPVEESKFMLSSRHCSFFMSQCNMLRCAFSALPQALLTSLTSSFAGAWRVT